jgi:hypothetical protein
MARVPLLNAPVERVTLPRLPVTKPIPFSPVTAISSEPLRLNPAVLPLSVPPLFVKSTELPRAATGRARVSASNQNMRFISFLLSLMFRLLVSTRADLKRTQLPPLGLPLRIWSSKGRKSLRNSKQMA